LAADSAEPFEGDRSGDGTTDATGGDDPSTGTIAEKGSLTPTAPGDGNGR
jgi:hypothetical protein